MAYTKLNTPLLMKKNKQQRFIQTVHEHYRVHGRHTLPWRQTTDPYRILVSEIMLQQTPVDRVLPKYQLFLKQFPTVTKLAAAPLGAVLRAWQGLGYNRRAKYVHQCAQAVVACYGGVFPTTYAELKQLPGIGPYTAGAVMAFAYNQPVPIVETNIRTVFLHHFFHDDTNVPDAAILGLVTETLDRANPRRWYAALMDYGVYLKKMYGNQNHRSRQYAKQSKFAGSDRQIRGAIVRTLGAGTLTRARLRRCLTEYSRERVDAQLDRLVEEGLVTKGGHGVAQPPQTHTKKPHKKK